VASTVFSFVRNGVTVAESGVAQTGKGHAFQLFVETSGDFGAPGSIRTGIAIANAGNTAAVVNLELSDMAGINLGLNTSITIPANGQLATFLDEIPAFANLPALFRGVLRPSTVAPAGFSMIGLRGAYNERGDFLMATMPYIDEELSNNDIEKVFPHIVTGDGYTTEFILMSPHGDLWRGTLLFPVRFSNVTVGAPEIVPWYRGPIAAQEDLRKDPHEPAG
jgi:hypothetical protein